MSRYKAYSEYKDSAVNWLNSIPTHWGLNRFKNIFKIQKKIAGALGYDVLSITQRGVKIKDTESGDGQLSMDYSKYQLVRKNDFAMNHMDLLTGYVDISKFDGVTSPDYRVFSLADENQHPRYFLYLLQLCYIAKIFYPLGQGAAQIGRWRLPTEAFSEFVAPTPAYAEQQSIAAFLDHETMKIDALIEKQQRLIELLKEKRQAVISHAVTKGLNPNAPMKDSGVEWLGEVPAHWNTQKLAWRFTAKKGSNAAQLTKEFCASIEGEHPVYSGQTENSGVMACIDSYEFDAGEEGYLFSTTVGAKAMTVMHITGKFSLSQNCMVIIPCTAYSIPRFYYYHFQPLFSYERGLIPEHMQASFRMEDLYQYKVLEPPKSEQIEIANFLDVNTAVFDDLISRSLNACLLLQERRTALISATVTGKIDVRDWQAAA